MLSEIRTVGVRFDNKIYPLTAKFHYVRGKEIVFVTRVGFRRNELPYSLWDEKSQRYIGKALIDSFSVVLLQRGYKVLKPIRLFTFTN